MPPTLRSRRVSRFWVFASLPVSLWFVLRPLLSPAPPLPALHASVGLSLLAGIATVALVPVLAPEFAKAGLKGKDLLKVHKDDVPESLGLVSAAVYVMTLCLFIPFPFSDFLASASRPESKLEGLARNDFPHSQLAVYLSSIMSLLIATMLGFLDDVFDIRWRHKLPIPIIASIPLLMVYFAERGITHVVVPTPLRGFLGTIIDVGPLYYLYMSMLSTFATNSINILAGINGSEVSQALVIACSIAINDLLYLPWPAEVELKPGVQIGGMWSAGLAYGSKELVERHLFSLYFMLPLIGVCAGFMYHNWYPARVFPGDTLCYISGMAFAVVGIQGHFSKTLLLFFLPQIFNFVLSCPQLFGLVPCPRHRVPKFNPDTNLLFPSTATFDKGPPSTAATVLLKVFEALDLVQLKYDARGNIVETTNLTILNWLLLKLGPLTEVQLVRALLGCQIAGSVFAFTLRHGLAWLVYDPLEDRR